MLVILGLLAGGIMAGQALIRAAELRSVAAGFARYETAVYAFRDKYFALPGDITNATAIWGKDTTSAAACAGQSGNAATPGTCNGNGDGYVLNSGTYEIWRLWQHLSLAGLVEGNYAGTQANWGTNATPGTDMPAGRIGKSGYMLWAEANTNSEFAWTDLVFIRNMIIFGSATGGWTNGGVVSSVEAWNIDTKLDDGLPGQGKVWTGATTSGCVTTTASATAQYVISGSNSTLLHCIMGKLL